MAAKIYTVITSKRRFGANDSTSTTSGTMDELINYFRYSLETGASYAHEEGNKKINLKPKTGPSLITNLNNAANNAAANGYSNVVYELQKN